MKKFTLISLCIFCVLISIAIGIKGYTDYATYREKYSTDELGEDILNGTNIYIESLQTLTTIATDIQKFFVEWIPNTFTNAIEKIQGAINYVTKGLDEIWKILKKWFKLQWIFDYFNGDSDNDSDGGDGNGGSGFGGGGGGFGGEGGGFRDLKEITKWNL